ncbi:MAG: flavin reductase family protein [Candidatus Hermodarchaeota archaeon]
MDKITINSSITPYPMPVALLGAIVNGKTNFMTVALLSRVGYDPPIWITGIDKRQYTAVGIKKKGTFSINFPSTSLIEKIDYCGIVSGRKTDKSQLFDVFYGELETAPMIRECPICLELKLKDTIELSMTFLFLGEVIKVYTEEQYLTEGKLDILKTAPVLYTGPDRNYWTIGEHLAKAFSVGKKLK